ncbi:MAG TPA: hypothetical protein EYP90_13835 [Chromatiaceae bacterium]|nr:hypothetical protein [Chromatiaceae bacterium]
MKLIRRLYIGAGIVWGIILGATTFFLIGAGVAGIFWLFVFGDNAWPNWAWVITYTIATITGLLTFGVCAFIGWHFSCGSQENEVDNRKQIVRVTSLLALSVIVIFGYAFYQRHLEDKYTLLESEIAEQNKKRAREEYRYKHEDESALDYYCRVVWKRSDKIELIYQGYRIKIVQSLVAEQGKAVFGVIGSYEVIKALSDDVIVFEQTQDGLRSLIESFEVSPEKMQCGKNMHFIVSSGYRYLSPLENIERVDCHIPSLRVAFPMKIRRIERNG